MAQPEQPPLVVSGSEIDAFNRCPRNWLARWYYGFVPKNPDVQVVELAGRLEDVNTPEAPQRIVPQRRTWPHRLKEGKLEYTFPAHSFSILRLE